MYLFEIKKTPYKQEQVNFSCITNLEAIQECHLVSSTG